MENPASEEFKAVQKELYDTKVSKVILNYPRYQYILFQK